MKVAELYALFAFKVDKKSLNEVHGGLRAMRGAALALGSVFAVGKLAKAMIGFNSRVEDAKTNIAGMLALAAKSTVASQLEHANKLYDDLRAKASELPGTTEEYVQALSKLTLPVRTAGLGLEQLKELTIATVVAAKAGVGGATVKTATTDVLQGIEGRFSVTDFFLKSILEPLDNGKYVGEAGRKLFKSLSKAMRAKEILRGLQNPAIKELAERQSQSFSGQMDKMKEATAQFLGRVGLPLFEELTRLMKDANIWLGNNKKVVDELAASVGGALRTGFVAFKDVIVWLLAHGDAVRALLWGIAAALGVMAVRSMLAALPVIMLIGRIALLAYMFEKLRDKIGTVGAVLLTVFGAALLFRFSAVVSGIKAITSALITMRATAAMSTGLGALSLNPVGSALGSVGGAAAKGGSGTGALTAAGVLGPVGLAAGITAGIIALGDAYDPTTNHAGAAAAAAAFKNGSSLWEATAIGANTKASTTTVEINAPVTIHGVKDEDMAKELGAAHDKMMRQTMESFSGGKR